MLLRIGDRFFSDGMPNVADEDFCRVSEGLRLTRHSSNHSSLWVINALRETASQVVRLLEDPTTGKDGQNLTVQDNSWKFSSSKTFRQKDSLKKQFNVQVQDMLGEFNQDLDDSKLVQRSTRRVINSELHQYKGVTKQHGAKWIPEGQHSPKVKEILILLNDALLSSSIEKVMEKYWVEISKYDVFCILRVLQDQHDWKRSLELFYLIRMQGWYVPNARLYARMMSFVGRKGHPDLVVNLFQEMVSEKCRPTQYTLTALLNAYGKARKLKEARTLFERMKTSADLDCKPNVVSCNVIMDAFVKGGLHDEALQIFADMRESRNGLSGECRPNAVTYNILIESLCKDGLIDRAVQLLHQMSSGDIDQEVFLNVAAYNIVITACGRSGLPHRAEELMNDMVAKGLEPDKITYTGLIDAYGKAGLFENSENALQGMKAANIEVDVMAYTAMIGAYASEGMYEKADELFKVMQQAGVQPNHVTYCALIDAYGKSGLPDEAHNVFRAMERDGYRANVYIYSALIYAYGNVGKYKEAADILVTMRLAGCKPNLIVYAALMSACKQCKCWQEASVLLDCLRQSESSIELSLFRLLSSSVDEPELWKGALEMCKKFEEEPKLPKLSFYNALVDILWNFGLRRRASKLLAIGKKYGIYSDQAHMASQSEWCLDLHALSVGAALVCLNNWLNELHFTWLWGEGVPDLIRIITGKGKHSRSKKSSLKVALSAEFDRLNAPFDTMETNTGSFAASGTLVRQWVFSTGTKQRLVLIDVGKNLNNTI